MTTGYDKWGRPSALSGSSSYEVGTDYTALGQLDLRKLGNTAGSPTLQTDYGYLGAAGNFRLQWIKTGPSSPFEGLQKLEYAYDTVGNVSSIKDYKAGGTQTQTFTYDALDRVISATVSGGTGGIYTETYAFNAISNLTSKGGVAYTYGATQPHAATAAGSNSYAYDLNGNMITRSVGVYTYSLAYDAENRLTNVKQNGVVTACFGYDGDGRLVTATLANTTTFYAGGHYEQTGSTVRKYYYHAGKRVAMREGSTPYWLATDHLGSTAMALTASGVISGELRYKAWGETRLVTGTTPTDYRFTGQREDSGIGLYFYNARWYDPVLGRFVQADTVVPQPGNPQALNRYSYVLNSPTRYQDPTGHYTFEENPDESSHFWEARVRSKYRWTHPQYHEKTISDAELLSTAAVVAMAAPGAALLEVGIADIALPAAEAAVGQVVAWAAPMAGQVLERGKEAIGDFFARHITERLAQLTEMAAENPILSEAEQAAIDRGAKTAQALQGHGVHVGLERLVQADPMLSRVLQVTPHLPPGQFSPDFYAPWLGRSWDLTTPGQWAGHVAKYGAEFGEGIRIVYP